MVDEADVLPLSATELKNMINVKFVQDSNSNKDGMLCRLCSHFQFVDQQFFQFLQSLFWFCHVTHVAGLRVAAWRSGNIVGLDQRG